MKRQIKHKFNRHLARMLTKLDALDITERQKVIIKTNMDYLEQDVLEILKITLQTKE